MITEEQALMAVYKHFTASKYWIAQPTTEHGVWAAVIDSHPWKDDSDGGRYAIQAVVMQKETRGSGHVYEVVTCNPFVTWDGELYGTGQGWGALTFTDRQDAATIASLIVDKRWRHPIA